MLLNSGHQNRDFKLFYHTIFTYFDRFGLNGKACIMRLICELAESQGLPYNGVLGKALEALFL